MIETPTPGDQHQVGTGSDSVGAGVCHEAGGKTLAPTSGFGTDRADASDAQGNAEKECLTEATADESDDLALSIDDAQLLGVLWAEEQGERGAHIDYAIRGEYPVR
jgi:hypothetical protein